MARSDARRSGGRVDDLSGEHTRGDRSDRGVLEELAPWALLRVRRRGRPADRDHPASDGHLPGRRGRQAAPLLRSGARRVRRVRLTPVTHAAAIWPIGTRVSSSCGTPARNVTCTVRPWDRSPMGGRSVTPFSGGAWGAGAARLRGSCGGLQRSSAAGAARPHGATSFGWARRWQGCVPLSK